MGRQNSWWYYDWRWNDRLTMLDMLLGVLNTRSLLLLLLLRRASDISMCRRHGSWTSDIIAWAQHFGFRRYHTIFRIRIGLLDFWLWTMSIYTFLHTEIQRRNIGLNLKFKFKFQFHFHIGISMIWLPAIFQNGAPQLTTSCMTTTQDEIQWPPRGYNLTNRTVAVYDVAGTRRSHSHLNSTRPWSMINSMPIADAGRCKYNGYAVPRPHQ